MKIYDISMEISPEMAVYKDRDEKRPVFETLRDFGQGSVYETRLQFDLHTGTHIDMPLHMIEGSPDSAFWHAGRFFSRCTVLDFLSPEIDAVKAQDLEAKEKALTPLFDPFAAGRSVLLKTRNSFQQAFDFSFVYLHQSGAAYLAGRDLAGVGIDALGIERDQPGHETHKALLKAGIWILEGLRLAEVPEGDYILVLMPLKVKGVEALPARAVLIPPTSMNLA